MTEGWGNKMFELDGITPKKDTKNPVKDLRNRKLKDLEIITDLVFSKGKYLNGKIYLANLGITMDCNFYLEKDILKMRIYYRFPIVGITKKWHKVQ